MSGATGRQATSPGHERRDISVAGVVIFGAGLVLLMLVALLAMRALFGLLAESRERESPRPSPLTERDQLPPAPRLQVRPREDLEALRAREDELLGTYGWPQREPGAFRIPIERALRRLAERDLRLRPPSGRGETPDAGTEDGPAEEDGGSPSSSPRSRKGPER